MGNRVLFAVLLAFIMLTALGCASAPAATEQTENTAVDTTVCTEAPADVTYEITEETVLTTYDGPKTMKSSEVARITANGCELFVYDVMVNHQHIWSEDAMPDRTPMTYFDFSGKVTLDIEMTGMTVTSASVLPSSYGITPTVTDGRVSFTVTEPGQYTVIYNGDVKNATHIFANPPETDVPDKNDPNVYYVGPGERTVGSIVLKDNQTLYIAGGAVLHSEIVVNGAKNVRICGRGMIDGSKYKAWNQAGSTAHVPISLNNAINVTVEGISIVNANCWCFNSYASVNVAVKNVKIISGRQNGDGFTFQSCNKHVVEDCFVRSWDDSLVVKNYLGPSKGITFRNIIVWTDLAQSMEIGYETNKGNIRSPEISDVLFENITVLYNFHKPIISIHNSDNAYIHDITYRNILVENAFMQGDNGVNKELIDVTMLKSGWSTVKDKYGSVDNVLIDGLTVVNTLNGAVPESRFVGHGSDNRITNVTMQNVTILGKRITSLEELNASVNEFCDNITVK